MADAEQRAVIDKILNQSPGNVAETQQATVGAASQPAPVPAASAQEKPPVEAPRAPEQPKKPRAQEVIDRLMQQTREGREKQIAEQRQREAFELAQRIQMAKELGDPNAVLKAAGVEPKKFDLSSLLAPESDEPKSVKELKEQVTKLDQYIQSLQKERETEKQSYQQQQMQTYQRQELENITRFIANSKDKYQYVSATQEMGSDKDLYNGMVSMYNQGYSPSHEDMADLVEARIEQLLESVAGTHKFSSFLQEKFGIQIGAKKSESPTLTGGMTADTPATIDPSKMTDEENRQYALKRAMEARERITKQLKGG